MTHPSGILLADLMDWPEETLGLLDGHVQSFLQRFRILDHETSRSDASIIHFGRLAPVHEPDDDEEPGMDVGFGRLQLPGVHSSLPFQLTLFRGPVTDDLEPAPSGFILDIVFEDLRLTLPELRPAMLVPETGTTPRHILPRPEGGDVAIVGSAVLRMEKRGDERPRLRFIDRPDPIDPEHSSGAVGRLGVSPPHFFVGDSEFGLTVRRLTFDFAEDYSPPEVIAANQGPEWIGILIQEATFFAPRNLPVVGDLSAGVRNLLLGIPMGLQGELEVQFGRSGMNPATFQFRHNRPDHPDGDQYLEVNAETGGTAATAASHTVTIETGIREEVSVTAGFNLSGPPQGDDGEPVSDLQGWTALWQWEDGTEEHGLASTGTVTQGDVLQVTPIETLEQDGEEVEHRHPTVSFRFVTGGMAPTIDARVDGEEFANTVWLSGTADELATVELHADSNADDNHLEWKIEGVPEVESGETLALEAVEELDPGTYWVVLTEVVGGEEALATTTRLIIKVLDEGQLLVGCHNGVFAPEEDPGTPQPIARVAPAAYVLSDFHTKGRRNVGSYPARRSSTAYSGVEVPEDGLAEVYLQAGSPEVLERDRHVQILLEFDDTEQLRWGERRPARARDEEDGDARRDGALIPCAFSQSDLLTWAARYPDADFLVVGRCGDLGSASYNRGLAEERALEAVRLLTELRSGEVGTPVDPARVYARGEQSVDLVEPPGFTPEAGEDRQSRLVELEQDDEIALKDAERSSSADNDDSSGAGWLIKNYKDKNEVDWPDFRDEAHDAEDVRETFRRADIYAVGGEPEPDTVLTYGDPTPLKDKRTALVPAMDRTPAPVPSGGPAMDYRVKLLAVWDSPTVTSLRDAIPTKAEAEFAWTPQDLPLPEAGEQPVDVSQQVLTLRASWAHDNRTGYTRATLGIESEGDPDGLFSTRNEPLVVALAFGPVLLSGVSSETGTIENAARIAPMLGAVGFASQLLADEPESRAVLTAAELETQVRSLADPGAATRFQVLVDYVCELHIQAEFLGLKTADDKPVRLRYKGVGLKFDSTKEGWDRIGIAYDGTALEIEDPGTWEVNGVLGKFLRVTEVTMGRGSVWVEARIAVGIDIGVVEITEAILRFTFDSESGNAAPTVQLRGLAAKIDVPATIKGDGRVRIEDSGVIRAGVSGSVIPAGLGVDAGVAFGRPEKIDPSVFLELFLGVQFATPLPLGQSGLAVHGLKGMFVMNGARALPSQEDPVQRELTWWGEDPGAKYAPEKGQYALGVGAVVGTMPDMSFTLSCSGMLVVAFPDPEVVFGVNVEVIAVPETAPQDKRDDADSATITGLIVIDTEAVTLAAAANYNIPGLLHVQVPFGAHFPFPWADGDVYVRIGSDGHHGRAGEPVTITYLPDTLDATAWGYLMVEQGGLQALGGNSDFDFDGFAVGFGAGWDIGWSAGPIKLEASAKVLVGFGTNPLRLKGGIFVNGELSLVVVSVSARGELILEARESHVRIDGEFCGKVRMLFFKLEGCVGVSIGGEPQLKPPEPPPPVTGISLTDRRDRVMGKATTGSDPAGVPVFSPDDPDSAADVDDNHTVWPDTAPVLHFRHAAEFALGDDAQFSLDDVSGNRVWWGSDRLKYAYRIDAITLRKVDPNGAVTSDELLRAVQTSSPYRPPNDASGENGPLPSEHEGINLKLLDWDPFRWVVNMDSGGDGTAGDPAGVIERLCDDKPAPRPACVFGRDARRRGAHGVRFAQSEPAPGPYPSRFRLRGTPMAGGDDQRLTGDALAEMVTMTGGTFLPGSVIDLPQPFSDGGESLQRGYRLPGMHRPASDGMMTAALAWRGRYDRPVVQPRLTLMVCDLPGQSRGGGDLDWDWFCDGFDDLSPRDAGGESIHRKTMRFRTLSERQQLLLNDFIDMSAEPPAPGRDEIPEVMFPREGMAIEFHNAVAAVELHVFVSSGEPVRIVAENADGDPVAEAQSIEPGSERVQVRRVHAGGEQIIQRVRLQGGDERAMLCRICHASETVGEQGGSPVVPVEAGELTVTGVEESGSRVEWRSRARRLGSRRDGRRCQIMQFAPGDGGRDSWRGFEINAQPGRMVMLVSACGIDQAAATAHADDTAADEALLERLRAIASLSPEERRPIVLDPETTYELAIDWSWQSWPPQEGDGDADDAPDAPLDANWETGDAQRFRFRTAADAGVEGTPEDGLNEYRFDPRDLARYLKGVEPGDGRAPHFTDDPVWAHFDCGHVEQLLEQYGRRLEIDIRPTNPPSQPDEEALQARLLPVALKRQWHPLPAAYQPLGYQRLNAAAEAAPCMPDATPGPFGGGSVAADAELERGAEYDLRLLAPREDGSDPALVHQSHFRTSWFASPERFVAALGYATDGIAPVAPDELMLDADPELGADDLQVSDSAMGAALAAFDAETLPPARERARSYLLWWHNGNDWAVCGLLVDSPEPLLRKATLLPDGNDARLQVGTRLGLNQASLDGTTMEPRFANTAWTRVLLAPSAPLVPGAGDHALELQFSVAEDELKAARLAPGRPAMLDREGF